MSKLVGISGVSGCGCNGVGASYNIGVPELPGGPKAQTFPVDLPVKEIAADVMAQTRTERLAITAGLAVAIIGGVWLVSRK